MVRGSRFGRASTVLLAVYLVSMVLVFSFILFEVLDIDGSDFPVAPMRAVTPPHPAESSHDIKRTHLASLGQLGIDLHPPVTDGVSLSVRVQRATSLAAAVGSSPVVLAFRVALARSSLGDIPTSA
jgi:hypothetical protein